ncbi:MAG: alpha/beta hydrolase [Pseudomonadales bacterium]|nr:alpha/beta hydrolase [Pseudomonadales bacterium]
MNTQLASPPNNDDGYRVLIAASDSESVTLDALAFEEETIKESISEKGLNNVQVETISTLNQDDFISKLNDFQPDIVQFSNRGSAQHNIRMISTGGLIRRITGETIAKLFDKAECYTKSIILLNCEVYREEAALLSNTDFILSIKHQFSTFGISPSIIQELHSCLRFSEKISTGFNQFVLSVGRIAAEQQIEVKVRANRIPNEISDDARDFFYTSEIDKDDIEKKDDSSPLHSSKALDIVSPKYLPGLERKRLSDNQYVSNLAVSDEGRRLYRVWFGTNRKPIGATSFGKFGLERESFIHYGYCDVLIPQNHKIGQVSDSWLKRWFWTGERNTLSIESRESLSTQSFFATLQEVYKSLPDYEDNLLVFLHGYNVDFDRAAIRAAQLGVDLGVSGTTAFFSWPSKGSYKGYSYMADEASIEASEAAIAEFLIGLSEQSGAKRIHIIAHSMGNRGILRAFNSMLQDVQKKIGKKIDQIFLAAPDVDSAVFENLAKAYDAVSNRATMYVSAKDMALWGSSILHSYERAGYTPPVTVVPNIDTVQVPRFNLDLIGHGYIADAKEVLTDMHALMKSNVSPDSRFGLKGMQTESGDRYWAFKV